MPIQLTFQCARLGCKNVFQSGTISLPLAIQRANERGWVINRITETWCQDHQHLATRG